MTSSKDIRAAYGDPGAVFDEVAGGYDRHAVVEREVAERLLERIAFQRLEPERIVDMGCGTGYCAALLKKRFRRAEVIGLDVSAAMCRETARRSGFLRPLRVVRGSLAAPPFADRSMDLVVASLALPWSGDLREVFNAWRRIVRPGGLVLFSTLGPASLRELVEAAETVVPQAGFRTFPDMHEIGDLLVAAGFDRPVMDAETLNVDYPGVDDLLAELSATGAGGFCDDWATVRAASAALAAAWPRRLPGSEKRPVLGWEIVYGAAFGPADGQPVRAAGEEVATFPVDALKVRRRPG